jgi:hypothetical protein
MLSHERRLRLDRRVKDFLREIGAKGGKATGESKVRGDSEHYRRLQKIGVRKRRRKKK